MNLLSTLQEKASKQQKNKIIDYVGNHQDRFDELLAYYDENDDGIKYAIAWAMSFCVEKYPVLLDTHFDFVLKNLKNPASNGVERNLYRALQYVDIPEEYQGELVNLACDKITDVKVDAAIKVFAMTVFYDITKKQTELREELALLIEDQLPHASTAFKNRGSKFLKALRV